MVQPVIVKGKRDFVRLKKNLKEPRKVLKQIGRLLVARSRASFRNQRFGRIQWKPLYNGSVEPSINIAGAVADLSKKADVSKKRFKKKALKDTGALLRSMTNKAAIKLKGQNAVEVGTNIPYAPVHQYGGKSSQPITKAVRSNLAKWLKKKANKKYRPVLGWLFQRKKLVTNVIQRPFVGVTEQDQEDIVELIEGRIPGNPNESVA